jgi:hypothetical protein
MATIPSELQNQIVGVRVDDIVNTNPSIIPGLANILVLLKKHPKEFFKQGKIETVHDIFFRQIPDDKANIITLELTAFVKYKKNVLTFEKLLISYPITALSIKDLTAIQTEAVYPLKDMMFHASVGLVERKLILEDDMKDIKLVFPIGVGSFDEGTMNEGQFSLLTPRFQNGYINQEEVISKRSKPRYFQGKPFIRISNGKEVTPIGFHIEINDTFVRGFDSHGCMRLREMDLMAFHDLVVYGSLHDMPLVVKYHLNDPADSPIGKRNKRYKTIVNVGTKESPFFILDRDNLVQLTYKEETTPPVDMLVDSDKDNYHQLFSYETIPQLREQDARRRNECQAQVMSGAIAGDPKTFEACMDAGKRKDSMRDRIYRKYMGIEEVNLTGASDPTGSID